MKEKKHTAARIIMTVLTVAAIAAIFWNSSRSAVESTQQSSPLTDWINSVLASLSISLQVTDKFIRKLAHFTEYSVLGVLMSVTVSLYTRLRIRLFAIVLASGALIAVCDELIQLTAEGRSCQVSDMALDTCGIAFGALIVTLILYVKDKRKKHRH